eukprot:gene1994-7990_t
MPTRRNTVRAKRSWNFKVENQGSSFINEDGKRLYRHVWQACTPNPKGIINILHEELGHCRRYDETANKLAANNFMVVSHDFLGHGRSEGERGVYNVDIFVRDACVEVRELHRKQPATPIFLLGMSLGAVVACRVSKHAPVAGIILVAPLAQVSSQALSKARLLNNIFPRKGVDLMDTTKLTHDNVQAKAYKEDSNVTHTKPRASSVLAIARACDMLQAHAAEVTAPVLVVHGYEDEIVFEQSSKDLQAKFGSEDKQFKTFATLWHDILHESPEDVERVHDAIIEWLDLHLEPRLIPKNEDETKIQADENPRTPPPSMTTSTATASRLKQSPIKIERETAATSAAVSQVVTTEHKNESENAPNSDEKKESNEESVSQEDKTCELPKETVAALSSNIEIDENPITEISKQILDEADEKPVKGREIIQSAQTESTKDADPSLTVVPGNAISSTTRVVTV